MPEIASLSFDIDSSQAQRAVSVLETLKASSITMTQAATQQTTATTNLSQAYSQQRDQLDRLAQTTRSYDGTLSGLITRLDQMRQVMSASQQGMTGYAQVLTQAAAGAVALNASVDGLDRYIARARVLNTQTNDLATGLERITTALKNQTVAGNDTQRMLTQMGVNTAGIPANRPDIVLQQIADQIRTHRMTATSIAGFQQILGPGFDAQAQMALGAQPYQTAFQRQDQDRQAAQRAQIDAQMAQIQRATMQLSHDQARYDNLNAKYFPGTTREERAATTTMSRGERMRVLERIDALPPDQRIANERPLYRIQEAARDSYVAGEYRHLTSGTWRSNQEQIFQRAQREAFDTGTAGAAFRGVNRSVLNALNLYEGPDPNDARALSGYDRRVLRTESAGILANYGDHSLESTMGAQNQRDDFSKDDKLRARYIAEYGPVEGNRRYVLQLGQLDQNVLYARAPEQRTLADVNREAQIMALPQQDRAEGRYGQQFLGQMRGEAATIMPVTGALTSITRNVNLNRPMQDALRAGFDQQTGAFVQRGKEDAEHQIQFQTGLTAALKDGRAAAEDYTRAATAWHDAWLSGVKDPAILAGIVKQTADVTEAQRISQGSAAAGAAEKENRDKREQLELTKALNAANATAIERQREMRQLSEFQQIRGGVEGGTLPGGDSPAAVATRARELAALQAQSPAQQAGADMAEKVHGQLEDTTAIVEIMVRQHATMEQASAELEKQKTLNLAIGELIKQGKFDEAEKLKTLQSTTQEMTRQQAMEMQRGRNIDATADQQARNRYRAYVATQPQNEQAGLLAGEAAYLEQERTGRTPATMAPSTIAPGPVPWVNQPAAQPYMGLMTAAAAKQGLLLPMFAELLGTESSMNPNARNIPVPGAKATTATGLGQQIAGNRYLHGANPLDPQVSIDAASEEWRDRLQAANGNAYVAARGYGATPDHAVQIAAAGGQSVDPRARLADQTPAQSDAYQALMAALREGTKIDVVNQQINAAGQLAADQAAERERGRLRAEGRTGDAERVINPDLRLDEDLRQGAQTRQSDVVKAGQADKAAALSGATDRQIDDINKLTEAYQHGQRAVDAATAAQQAEAEALQLGKDSIDKQARVRQLLTERLAQSEQRTAEENKQRGDDLMIQKGLAARGPFSDELDQASTRRNLVTQQHIRDNGPGWEQSAPGQGEIAANRAADETDRLTKSMQDSREAVQSMQGSFNSAFEGFVIHGEKGRDVLKGLREEMETIIMRNLVEKPLDRLMNTAMTSIMGGNETSPGTGGGGAAGDGSTGGLGGLLANLTNSRKAESDPGLLGGIFNNSSATPHSDGSGASERMPSGGGGDRGASSGTTLPNSSAALGFTAAAARDKSIMGSIVDALGRPGMYKDGGIVGSLWTKWNTLDPQAAHEVGDTTNQALQAAKNAGPGMFSGVSSAFSSAGSWISNLFSSSATNAASQAAALPGLYATGGIFPGPFFDDPRGAPMLQRFEDQIVDRPTLFRFAAGGGIMGEAGPEAILPLMRGANGKLGLAAPNSGGITHNWNITTQDADSFQRSIGQIQAKLAGSLGHSALRNQT